MTTFYIVRHGETQANIDDLLSGGKHNPTLTKNGIKQAKDLSNKLKDVRFDKIFSSDLTRAVQTAEVIALDRKLVVETTKALREKFYGKWEGKKRDEVIKSVNHLFKKFEELPTDEERMEFKKYGDGESDLEAVTRFITHLRELAIANEEKTLLIVSHGGIMFYLLVRLGFGSYSDFGKPPVKNTAYIKLESDGIDFFIKEVEGINKKETN